VIAPCPLGGRRSWKGIMRGLNGESDCPLHAVPSRDPCVHTGHWGSNMPVVQSVVIFMVGGGDDMNAPVQLVQHARWRVPTQMRPVNIGCRLSFMTDNSALIYLAQPGH